jgi:hypothetical protein
MTGKYRHAAEMFDLLGYPESHQVLQHLPASHSASPPRRYQYARSLPAIWATTVKPGSVTCTQQVCAVFRYWGAAEQKPRLRIQATSTINSDGLRSGRNRGMATISRQTGPHDRKSKVGVDHRSPSAHPGISNTRALSPGPGSVFVQAVLAQIHKSPGTTTSEQFLLELDVGFAFLGSQYEEKTRNGI